MNTTQLPSPSPELIARHEAQMKEHNACVSSREARGDSWCLLAHAVWTAAAVVFVFYLAAKLVYAA